MDSQHTPASERSVLPKYLQQTLYATRELSHLLDTLNVTAAPSHDVVRAVMNAFVVYELTEPTVDLYSRHFGEEKVSRLLGLMQQGHAAPLEYLTPGAVLARLFTAKDPWRLKQCGACQSYFFDETRKGTKQYCTLRCTSRQMTRLYRQRQRQALRLA